MARRSHIDRALISTAIMLLAVACTTFLMGSIGGADTVGTPDTNTRATLAPDAPPGPSPVATTGIVAPGPLTGVVGGQTTHVHVDGAPGKFNGVQVARLCRGGLTVTTSSQLSPTFFGNCIGNPFPGAPNDAALGGVTSPIASDAGKQFVDFDFRIGSGVETVATHIGPGTPIACDASNPCSLWLQESVDATVSSTGVVFKHFDIQYAGAATTTTEPSTTTTATSTTTVPSTSTTSANTTTTTSTTITATTSAPSTTTTSPSSPSRTTPSTSVPLSISASSVTPGGTITLQSDGWMAASAVAIVLHSDPVHLADATAGANGTITATLVIPVGTAPGAHNVNLSGVAPDAVARTLTIGITVLDASSSSSSGGSGSSISSSNAAPTTGAALARTGFGPLRDLWTGTSLLGAGALLVIAAQRRRTRLTR